MSGKSIVGAVLAGAVLAAAAAAGLRALLGGSAPVVLGMAVGFALGAGGAALEVVVMARAMGKDPRRAMNVVLGGLGIRLVVLMLLTVVFHFLLPAVNETAFALSFVAGFVAALPAVGMVSLGRRGPSPAAPPAPVRNGEVHA
jgi:hypothetical protein